MCVPVPDPGKLRLYRGGCEPLDMDAGPQSSGGPALTTQPSRQPANLNFLHVLILH